MIIRYCWKMLFKLFGWETKIIFPKHIKTAVILIGPHTSGWDFILGLGYRSIMCITHSKFLGKKELFNPPFGFIFHWLGGTPVDRFGKKNLVEQVVEKFQLNKEFLVALSPEGTRKRVDKLKTGFYNIAKLANVPIVFTGIDFKNKTLIVSEPFFTTENMEQDLEKVMSFYRNIEGKNLENDLRHL